MLVLKIKFAKKKKKGIDLRNLIKNCPACVKISIRSAGNQNKQSFCPYYTLLLIEMFIV